MRKSGSHHNNILKAWDIDGLYTRDQTSENLPDDDSVRADLWFQCDINLSQKNVEIPVCLMYVKCLIYRVVFEVK